MLNLAVNWPRLPRQLWFWSPYLKTLPGKILFSPCEWGQKWAGLLSHYHLPSWNFLPGWTRTADNNNSSYTSTDNIELWSGIMMIRGIYSACHCKPFHHSPNATRNSAAIFWIECSSGQSRCKTIGQMTLESLEGLIFEGWIVWNCYSVIHKIPMLIH